MMWNFEEQQKEKLILLNKEFFQNKLNLIIKKNMTETKSKVQGFIDLKGRQNDYVI